jgi:hypothetical protein
MAAAMAPMLLGETRLVPSQWPPEGAPANGEEHSCLTVRFALTVQVALPAPSDEVRALFQSSASMVSRSIGPQPSRDCNFNSMAHALELALIAQIPSTPRVVKPTACGSGTPANVQERGDGGPHRAPNLRPSACPRLKSDNKFIPSFGDVGSFVRSQSRPEVNPGDELLDSHSHCRVEIPLVTNQSEGSGGAPVGTSCNNGPRCRSA